MNSVEYKVLPNKTAPYGSFGKSLNMFISLVFGFIIPEEDTVIGGGGVGCIMGMLKPGVGIPTTGNPGTAFGIVLSKSYGLLLVFVYGFVYFLSFFLSLLSFFLFFSRDELEDESDEAELFEELE